MMNLFCIPLQMNPTDGMVGETLPYLLRSDWLITGILFLCLILTSFAFSRGKVYLLQQMKSFFTTRERASLFDDATATDLRFSIVLILQTCMLLSLYLYDYFALNVSQLFETTPRILILSAFIFGIITFLLMKWLLFYIVNKTFFNQTQNTLWMNAYWNIIIWIGFLFLPVIMLVVYFDISSQNSLLMVLFVILCMKILLFYRCFRNFFNKLYGTLHFILYFCALEILPDLILWKGIQFSISFLH